MRGRFDEAGPDALFAHIRTLSWRLLPVLFFPYVLVTTLHTLGWRFAFSRDPASFGTLFSVRLAGEAFNAPTTSLGGEPLKALLLRPHISLGDSLAAVIADKTTITVAQNLFLAVGLASAWLLLPVPSVLLQAMTWLLVAEALALGGFAMVQMLGGFGRGLSLLTRLGLAWGEPCAEEFRQLDQALAAFYRGRPGRLGLSLFFHLLGWLLGSIEVYVILRFLGVPVSLVAALVIEAVTTAIRFMAFMIPAGLGAVEGGTMALFAALGLDPGMGLSQTLIRRLRELTWTAVGLLLLARLQPVAPEPGRRSCQDRLGFIAEKE